LLLPLKATLTALWQGSVLPQRSLVAGADVSTARIRRFVGRRPQVGLIGGHSFSSEDQVFLNMSLSWRRLPWTAATTRWVC